MNIRFAVAVTLLTTVGFSAIHEADAAGRQNRSGNGTCMQNGAAQGSACRGSGTCASITPAALDAAEIARLRYMYEEEKLAGNVYVYSYNKWGLAVFSRIAASENKHQQAILRQLQLHQVDSADLEALPAGSFANPELQSLYHSLIALVNVSSTEALRAGMTIEQQDIADLDEALTETDAPELDRVYTNLKTASERHLVALTRQGNLGSTCPSCTAGMRKQQRQRRAAALGARL